MEHKITSILLTGAPGVGKTTLIRKILTALRKIGNPQCMGFYTTEVRANGTEGPRIGFDIVTCDNQHGILAREKQETDRRAPRVGKYLVYVSNFIDIIQPILTSIDKNHLLIIDEIGKMELKCEYFENVLSGLDPKQPLLATIPLETANGFIPAVERLKTACNSKVFHVTKQNRNKLLPEILDLINKLFVK